MSALSWEAQWLIPYLSKATTCLFANLILVHRWVKEQLINFEVIESRVHQQSEAEAELFMTEVEHSHKCWLDSSLIQKYSDYYSETHCNKCRMLETLFNN